MLRRLFGPKPEHQPRVQRVACHCAHDTACVRCHGVGFTVRVRKG